VRRGLRGLAFLACVAWPIASLSAQDPAADAVERLRIMLEQPPPTLSLQPQRPPDFSVHIEKRRPMQDIFDVPAWTTGPVGWQPPRLGIDLLSVFRSVKRSADERRARGDVRASVAEFCNTQPNLGAGIQICDAAR
jgi:hypothetical protein